MNGRTVAAAGESIVLEGAKRGDEVELQVVASDGRAESAPVSAMETLANSTPVLSELTFEPAADWKAGGVILVHPGAQDPDGDALEFEYQWQVNGRAQDEATAILSTEGLRRGDRVRVRVIASDGDVESRELWSDELQLVNAAPVVETLPEEKIEGGVFRYQIVARDPDGDRALRYRLTESPEGMQIDPLAGAIEWTPTPEQEGSHSVSVEVDDRKGGKTEQVFHVFIRLEEPESPPAAPAEDAERSGITR